VRSEEPGARSEDQRRVRSKLYLVRNEEDNFWYCRMYDGIIFSDETSIIDHFIDTSTVSFTTVIRVGVEVPSLSLKLQGPYFESHP